MASAYTRRVYTESDRTAKARKNLEEGLPDRPGAYGGRWEEELEAVLGAILGRGDFAYDPASDPLYRMLQESYVNQGRNAMLDTLGRSASLTGGYGNSYADLVGQQAYQAELQGLNDRLPELYRLALDAYDRQSQADYDRYAAILGMDERDYSRWQDGQNAWLAERDYLAGRYDTERGFDYSWFRDEVGDDQWQAEFDESVRRYDHQHGLGEFARPAGSGESGSSGGSGTKKKKKKEEAKPASSTMGTHISIPSRQNPTHLRDESY